MSPLSVTLFSVMFTCVAALIGKYYKNLHISYTIWFWITMVSVVAFLGLYIFENFIQKKSDEED